MLNKYWARSNSTPLHGPKQDGPQIYRNQDGIMIQWKPVGATPSKITFVLYVEEGSTNKGMWVWLL